MNKRICTNKNTVKYSFSYSYYQKKMFQWNPWKPWYDGLNAIGLKPSWDPCGNELGLDVAGIEWPTGPWIPGVWWWRLGFQKGGIWKSGWEGRPDRESVSEFIFLSFDEIFLFRVWIPSFFIVAGLETWILKIKGLFWSLLLFFGLRSDRPDFIQTVQTPSRN